MALAYVFVPLDFKPLKEEAGFPTAVFDNVLTLSGGAGMIFYLSRFYD